MDGGQQPYATYVTFKGWDGSAPQRPTEEHRDVLRHANLPASYRHLDVGFGSGELLDFSKSKGGRTFGTDIIPELTQSAKMRGHIVFRPDLSDCQERFEVITAIDVLEHLQLEELKSLIVRVRDLLTPDGVFIARFPNGQSPFSGPWQHGDLTHVRFMTPGLVRQVAEPLGMALAGAFNPRPLPSGLAQVRRRCVYAVRDLIEVVIGYCYYAARMPLDPNVIVTLRRSETMTAQA